MCFILCHMLKKMEKQCDFPMNTFFAPYRVWRFSIGLWDCLCRVKETFTQGSLLLCLPSLLQYNSVRIKPQIFYFYYIQLHLKSVENISEISDSEKTFYQINRSDNCQDFPIHIEILTRFCIIFHVLYGVDLIFPGYWRRFTKNTHWIREDPMFIKNTHRILKKKVYKEYSLNTRFSWNTHRILENNDYLEYSQDTGEQCLPGILPGYWRTMITWNTPRILENNDYLEYSQDTGEQWLPGILPGYWRTMITWNTPRILENKAYLEYSKDTGEQGLPRILKGYWQTRFTWILTGYKRTSFTWNTHKLLENNVYLEYFQDTGEQGLPWIYSQYTEEQGLPGINSQDTGENDWRENFFRRG